MGNLPQKVGKKTKKGKINKNWGVGGQVNLQKDIWDVKEEKRLEHKGNCSRGLEEMRSKNSTLKHTLFHIAVY